MKIKIRMWIIKYLSYMERKLTNFDKDKCIYDLWNIIEDIDQVDDMAHYDDELYRARVDYLQSKRWRVGLPDNFHEIVRARYSPQDEEGEEDYDVTTFQE